jgi:hypothetical protein
MADEEISKTDTIRRFHEALVSSRAVADQLGLPMVAIKLDGAIIELEKVLYQDEPSTRTQ